jgi:hypothetical protein
MATTQEDNGAVTAQNSSAGVRREGLQGARTPAPQVAQQSGGTAVAVSAAPTAAPVRLTARELKLYQAGQAFGEAAAYKRAAELLERFTQASVQRTEQGNRLLSEALTPTKPPSMLERVRGWFTRS